MKSLILWIALAFFLLYQWLPRDAAPDPQVPASPVEKADVVNVERSESWLLGKLEGLLRGSDVEKSASSK